MYNPRKLLMQQYYDDPLYIAFNDAHYVALQSGDQDEIDRTSNLLESYIRKKYPFKGYSHIGGTRRPFIPAYVPPKVRYWNRPSNVPIKSAFNSTKAGIAQRKAAARAKLAKSKQQQSKPVLNVYGKRSRSASQEFTDYIEKEIIPKVEARRKLLQQQTSKKAIVVLDFSFAKPEPPLKKRIFKYPHCVECGYSECRCSTHTEGG